MSDIAAAGLDVVAHPGVQEVVVTRRFDAPRDRVFKTYTDPALIPQWWGPKDLATIVDRMEVRPGGRWRFVHRAADGTQYGFHGVYHDAIAPERLVATFEFEGMPGHVSLDTATFEEDGSGTRLTVQSVFQSVTDRDGMLEAGMIGGLTETMDRLAALLESSA
jgi:uncharacterized protein YndB with AHSA1/START domain